MTETINNKKELS